MFRKRSAGCISSSITSTTQAWSNRWSTWMYQLEHYIHNSGLEQSLVHLVKMRASQINGCAYCLDMHESPTPWYNGFEHRCTPERNGCTHCCGTLRCAHVPFTPNH